MSHADPSACSAGAAAEPPPPCVVVMGVSGCGKSTLGQALAQRLGLRFVEGDELHPPRNVALMAAGTPLTDDDRRDWLQALAQVLAQAHGAGQGVVVSCSALKRAYRDTLRQGAPGLRLVFLHGPQPLLAQRLAGRQGHYMPPSLLQSQLDTLQPPGADEGALALAIESPLAVQVEQALAALRAGVDPPFAGLPPQAPASPTDHTEP